jgi:hypothetical protein
MTHGSADELTPVRCGKVNGDVKAAGVFIGGVAETHGSELLAPQPLGPFLADASGPQRQFASHQLGQHSCPFAVRRVLNYPLPAAKSWLFTGRATPRQWKGGRRAVLLPDELASLQADFPQFQIWRETTCRHTRYIARRLHPGVHPHTLVSPDPDEIRAELSASSSQSVGAQGIVGDAAAPGVAEVHDRD